MRNIALFAVLGTLAAGVSSQAAEIRLVEEIIAKVNGDIITRGETEKLHHQIEADLRQQNLTGQRLTEALATREKDILRERIDQLLLIHKAKELSINVDPEVSKYLADMQRQFKIADPDKFQQFVRENAGMPFEDYKNDYKNSLLTNRVIRQEVGGRINIPKDDLKKYYEEHKEEFKREEKVYIREILVSTEGKPPAEAALLQKKATDLSVRAKKGEKFPELAQQNSDAVTAQQGGALDAFSKGQLKPELEAKVWDQPRGYVTDPIKVDAGYLILRVEEHTKAGQATFEEVENEVQEKLFMPKMGPAVREYLTKLRQDAFLEIKAGYVDSGAAPNKNTTWSDPAQLKPETVTKAEVANQTRHKKFLWIPIPGTKTQNTKASSSK
ncbi:MAG: peptidylprolyl isomerase [Bryobacteraceae bacterium]